jgi:spore photoproduct lyase
MFVPQRVIFEKEALNYTLGRDLHAYFEKSEIPITEAATNKIKSLIPGKDIPEQYSNGKNTLVVGIKKSLNFQSCKPSAHYQLPLVSGCIGQCEYCYLNTQLGDKPFVKIHVNIDEILEKAQKYIEERLPDVTIFEGAATSDPVPVEPYTHSLKKCINFFAGQPNARFRFVTKYNDIDDLLDIEHNNHTEIRFSLNTNNIIQMYEHRSASAAKRIDASAKLAAAGYPIGFIIAPVFIYDSWKADYHSLLDSLQKTMPDNLIHPLTFEVISHRFTTKAKNRILQIFPETTLDMNEEQRQFKFGQFGYGKYVYPKDQLSEIKEFFSKEITSLFEGSVIKYII